MEDKSWKPFGVDVLAGIVTSVLLLLIGVTLHKHQVLAAVLMVGLAVGAAIARAGREPSAAWAHGLLLGAATAAPIFGFALFAAGARSNPGAWVFLISSLILCSFTAEVTALFRNGRSETAALLGIVCVAAVSLLWTAGLRIIGPRPKLVSMDEPLPELGLKRMDGTPIADSELRGRVTVLDFWGTWCPSCVEEMPMLQELAASYRNNPGVQFLLVNPELNGDEPGRIGAFLHRKGISIPVALDPSQSCFKLHTELFPTTLVIDRRGRMRYERSGYSTAAELHGEIEELLTQR